MSADSHMGEFIAEKIEGILDQIGPSKFSAIVSDNGSNVKKACDIIEKNIQILKTSDVYHII